MFPIIIVPDNAVALVEQVGTRPKFWFDHETRLFKEGRRGTGENWAEVVASRLCTLLGLPCADYDFSRWNTVDGVVTTNFAPASEGRLVLGNELLPKVHADYDGTKRYKQTQYSLNRVRAVLRAADQPQGSANLDGLVGALDVFVGYLMLDAWIANQDRHHENWGVVLAKDGRIRLAPTFDHAAGFAPRESDDRRMARLQTKDHGYSLEGYAERARTPFYPSSGSGGVISTVDAFKELAHHHPKAKQHWLGRLSRVDADQVAKIFDQVPSELITRPAIDFATKLLQYNRGRLLKCQ